MVTPGVLVDASIAMTLSRRGSDGGRKIRHTVEGRHQGDTTNIIYFDAVPRCPIAGVRTPKEDCINHPMTSQTKK